MTDTSKRSAAHPQKGLSYDNPLPTLEWPGSDKPASWWGVDSEGHVAKIYDSYEDYCND